MAVPKEKVAAVLESRFKGKLTKNFIDGVAEKWATKIDTEEGIDKFVEDHEDVLTLTTSEADRRATQAAAKARTEAAKAVSGEGGEKPKQDEAKAPEIPDGTPDWMKTYIQNQQKQMDTLVQTVTGLQTANSQKSFADRLKEDPRTKDVPANFYKKWPMPTDDASFETFAEELKTEYAPFAGTATNGRELPPGMAARTTTSAKVDQDVIDFAKSKNETVTKQKA